MTERPRILFVDDDEHILNGVRNLLRRRRHEWDIVYAVGADAAVQVLDIERFDIVVSDVRMPKMSGIELLGRVRDLHPTTHRVILTGFAGPSREVGDFSVAHKVLDKPCSPVELQRTLEDLLAGRVDEVVTPSARQAG